MSEIKQVWGIIKDYQCADLNMVLEPAVAVWKHQQAKVDEIEHQKSLQELAINQISQANQEWQRINAELQKQIDELQKKIKDQIDLLKEASKSHAYNYREQNIMLSQADDLEKILRGEHE